MRLPFDGDYQVTQGFGIDLGFKYGIHEGIDYALPKGTPLYAAAAGTVLVAGVAGDAGIAVTIRSGNLLIKTFHMNSATVSIGQKVNKGDPIGTSGSTGYSTGPHLHFQVETGGVPVDPLSYIDKENIMSMTDQEIKTAFKMDLLRDPKSEEEWQKFRGWTYQQWADWIAPQPERKFIEDVVNTRYPNDQKVIADLRQRVNQLQNGLVTKAAVLEWIAQNTK